MDDDLLPRNKAQRVARAQEIVAQLQEEGVDLHPVQAKGQKISKTFWGQAWNRNLENYQIYAERLPRGRSHLRAGAVIDFQLAKGKIRGRVAAESLFEIVIEVDLMEGEAREDFQKLVRAELSSLTDLLTGNFSDALMEKVSSMEVGLFPDPNEITCRCHCEDYADLCAHSAAILYACSVHFDESPESLFTLRGIDPCELVMQGIQDESSDVDLGGGVFQVDQLEALFGIHLDAVEDKKSSKDEKSH